MNKVIQDRSGATAIEYALMLPLIVAFFIGFFETGMYIYNDMVISNAGKEASRKVSIGASESEVEQGLIGYFGDDYNRNIEDADNGDRESRKMIEWGVKSFNQGFDDPGYASFLSTSSQGNYSSIMSGSRDIGGDSNSGKISVMALCHNQAVKLDITGILPSRICTWNVVRNEKYADE